MVIIFFLIFNTVCLVNISSSHRKEEKKPNNNNKNELICKQTEIMEIWVTIFLASSYKSIWLQDICNCQHVMAFLLLKAWFYVALYKSV